MCLGGVLVDAVLEQDDCVFVVLLRICEDPSLPRRKRLVRAKTRESCHLRPCKEEGLTQEGSPSVSPKNLSLPGPGPGSLAARSRIRS